MKMYQRSPELIEIPNWFAYVALAGWPFACVALFNRLPIEKAAVWSLLGGYMLLPSDLFIDLPLLHPMDKMAISALATLLLCWMKGGQERVVRRSILIYILGFGFVIAPILTSLGNSYELQEAGKSVHGFYPMDGVKFAGRNLLMLIPFHIGRRYLSSEAARILLLKAVPSAMVIYSLPMLFELRMSPQLHRQVYGYFPSSFVQQMRDGGFRPVVFFSHGLELAFFTSLAVLCAFVVTRSRLRLLRTDPRIIAAYLSGLLVLCKSLGPLSYSLVFAPIIAFTKPRLWTKLGCAVSLIVCAYPFLRSHSLAPTNLISDVAMKVSAERDASLKVRLENEDMLLAKAEQKPWFGWGAWSRNRVFDKWTGKDISLTDGTWIIYFGMYGWLGYLSFFGLLASALFQAHRTIGHELTRASVTIGGLSLLLTASLINCIPNSVGEWLLFLLAGTIASRSPVRATHERGAQIAQPQPAFAGMGAV
ncbi:MAG TPA: hypothetical protein VGU01_01515 [Sphingomicrobium sp.]|nr:hypothetical protein [Sphingomicrobium sp.]